MDPMSVADRVWPLTRRVAGLHTWLYRTSNGRFGHRMAGFPPILLLEHEGAKSGKVRTTPLAYVDDGDDVVIVASKGGYPRHPAWYHNLRAHPDTTVRIGGEVRRVHARVADPAERERLWPLAVKAYGGYAGYQERAGREIPLVILEPRSD